MRLWIQIMSLMNITEVVCPWNVYFRADDLKEET